MIYGAADVPRLYIQHWIWRYQLGYLLLLGIDIIGQSAEMTYNSHLFRLPKPLIFRKQLPVQLKAAALLLASSIFSGE